MNKDLRIDEMSRFIPRLRQGHRGDMALVRCPRGCDAEYRRMSEIGKDLGKAVKAYNGRHFLSGDKRWDMAETFLKTGKWPERARKEGERDEEHLSAERWGFREQSVIGTFNSGDLVQIVIPFLALKHGALKEPENKLLHGTLRTVLPIPHNASRYERLVTVKFGDKKTIGVPAVWCHLVKPTASA